MEPVSLSVEAVSKAYETYHWAKRVQEDHHEMVLLIDEACALAVAEAAAADPGDDGVKQVVGAIGRSLNEISPEPSSRLGRLKAKIPGVRRIRARPKKRPLSEPDPVDQLVRWVGSALDRDAVVDQLARLASTDRPVSADDVRKRLQRGFERALVRDAPNISGLREDLLGQLAERKGKREVIHELQVRNGLAPEQRARPGLALLAAASIGVIGGGAADVTHFDTPEAALVGLGVGAAAVVIGALGSRMRKQRLQADVVREAALGLVGEIICPDNPLPPVARVLATAIGETVNGGATVIAPPDAELLYELDRLVVEADKAGEAELTAALTRLGHRVRRWMRRPNWVQGRPETREALLAVIEAAAVEPPKAPASAPSPVSAPAELGAAEPEGPAAIPDV